MNKKNENLPLEESVGEQKLSHLQPASKKKTLVGIIIVLAMVAGFILLLKTLQPEPPIRNKQEKTWTVDTIKSEPGSYAPQLSLLGQIESPATSALQPAISADIAEVFVVEGERVIKGQRLVRLDDQETRIAAIERQADVEDIRAQIAIENASYASNLKALEQEKALVRLAENAVQRERRLQKSNVTSVSKLDAAQRILEQQRLSLQAKILNVKTHDSRSAQLKARLERAQAMLQKAELDISRTLITAPFDGIVTSVQASVGERVGFNNVLVTLFDQQHVEIRAQIPRAELPIIAEALRNHTELNGTAFTPLGQIPVKLDRLSGATRAGTGGIDGLFLPTETLAWTPLGQTIDLRVDLPEVASALLVPISSIYGTQRIYLVEQGRLKGIDITRLGSRLIDNREWLLVSSPQIHSSSHIVTTQLPTAVEGLKVHIRKPKVPGNE